MTNRIRTPILLALLIAAMLASAYLIVASNAPAASGSAGQMPAGVLH